MKKYVVMALSLSVMACSQHSEPNDKVGSQVPGSSVQTQMSQQLNAYSWQLVEAMDKKNQRINALFVRTDMPLTLHFQENHISIANSCNNMGSTFTVTGNSLKVSDIISTTMSCGEQLNTLDSAISGLIAGTSTLNINNKAAQPQLKLTTAHGETLVFRGIATPETKYGSKAETIFLEIAPQTKTCSAGTRQMDCLQVKEVKYDEKGLKTYHSSQWLNFYDNIDGYTHNSNEKVIVRVKKYTVKNPPADMSSFAYILDTTIEQERVN